MYTTRPEDPKEIAIDWQMRLRRAQTAAAATNTWARVLRAGAQHGVDLSGTEPRDMWNSPGAYGVVLPV